MSVADQVLAEAVSLLSTLQERLKRMDAAGQAANLLDKTKAELDLEHEIRVIKNLTIIVEDFFKVSEVRMEREQDNATKNFKKGIPPYIFADGGTVFSRGKHLGHIEFKKNPLSSNGEECFGPTYVRADLFDDAITMTNRAIDALRFYAEPQTYHAMTILSDPPCGAFLDDFSKPESGFYKREMPGKLARERLAEISSFLEEATETKKFSYRVLDPTPDLN